MALVAAYGFEGTGSTITDSGPHGLDGTLSGATRTTSGYHDDGIACGSATDRVEIPADALLDFTSTVTVSMWVYPTSLGNWDSVYMKMAGAEPSYILYAGGGNGGVNTPTMYMNFGGNDEELIATSDLTVNAWNHLAISYDGSNMRIFIGGVAAGTYAITDTIRTGTGVTQICSDSKWGGYFLGRIDDVRIYNHAQTPAEIAADMLVSVVGGGGPAPVTVTPDAASLALASTAPTVTNIPAAVTVTSDDSTLGITSTQPTVTHVLAGTTATPDSAAFAIASSAPVVTNIADVTLTAASATFALNSSEVVMITLPAASATFGITSSAPVVTHVPASGVVVTSDYSAFGITSDTPVVTHVPVPVTVTPDTAALSITSSVPTVTHIPAPVTVTPDTATFAISSTQPTVTNIDAVTLTAASATFALSSTQPVITMVPTTFSIVDVDGNAVDPTVYDNQTNVQINCLNAGAVEGIVDYGEAGNRIVQTGITWPATPSGASTITVAEIDSGVLTLGPYELRVLKPI